MTRPMHVKAGEGERIEHRGMGIAMRVLVPAAATGADFCLIHEETDPGDGPPLHVHPRQTELFLVLEGEYEFALGGERLRAGPGDALLVPPGTPHTFRNVRGERSRLVFLLAPALEGERFFRELAALVAGGVTDPAALNAFAAPFGTEFVGPPLGAAAGSGG